MDVVLNSLTGEFIAKGLSVLRPGGRFLEIGKVEIWDKTQVARVRADVSYDVIALDRQVAEEPERVGKRLRALMEGCQALPQERFGMAEV